jgi:hypothetical protein
MMNIVNTPSLQLNRERRKANALAPAVQIIVPKPFNDSYCGTLSDEQFYFVHLLSKKMLESTNSHQYINLNIQILSKQLGSMPRERQIQQQIRLENFNENVFREVFINYHLIFYAALLTITIIIFYHLHYLENKGIR